MAKLQTICEGVEKLCTNIPYVTGFHLTSKANIVKYPTEELYHERYSSSSNTLDYLQLRQIY